MVLFLLSNDSVESAYCQAEFEEATRLQKQFAFVQVRGRTRLTSELRRYQYVDMSQRGVNDGQALTTLYRSIDVQAKSAKRRRPLWKPATPYPGDESDHPSETDETLTLNVPRQHTPMQAPSRTLAMWQGAAAVLAILIVVFAAYVFLIAGDGDDTDGVTNTPTEISRLPEVTPDTPTATTTPSETPTDTPTVTLTPSETPTNPPPDPPGSVSNVSEITIWWGEWDPANILQQIGNEYEDEVGIAVNVVQEPWGSYYDRIAAEWAAQGDSWDMLLGESQWLGQGVTEGHYLDLTDFLTQTGIANTVTASALRYHAEYPIGTGRYYAYPTFGDAIAFAYRADLWQDPDNQAAFEEAYGYPLAVPQTWAQLRDMAEFFTRPNEGLYGIGVYTQVDFEALTIGFENVFFSFGADWFDQNNNVLGVVYSPEAIAALELYRELYSFAPPGTDNAFFAEMNDVFINGQAAMIMNFFAFFPVLENPTNNPYADVTGYFPIPAGPNGDRFTTIGGQSLSVNTYVSDERQQAALDFIQWFAQDEVQSRWAELGGFTTNTTVLQSPEFVAIAPYNPAFAESMTMLKDFWRIPGNETLLESTQRWLHAYIVGSEGNAEEILINLAFEQHEILVEMGIILE